MSYATTVESGPEFVRQMIALGLAENAGPVVGTADPNADVAAAVLGNPKQAALALYPKLVVAPDNITAESNKSTMKTAVWNTTSILVLRAIFGL